MKKTILMFAIFITSIAMYSSCSKSDSNNGGGGGTGGTKPFSCAGITPKFSTDITPILTTVCSINSNCHAGGSSNTGGPFTNYTEVNAKKSNIRAAILAGTMPQNGTLTQAQINAFICWIDSGAPNN